MDFYLGLLTTAFEYVEKKPEHLEMLNNEYITFQEGLIKYHTQKNNLTILNDNMFDS